MRRKSAHKPTRTNQRGPTNGDLRDRRRVSVNLLHRSFHSDALPLLRLPAEAWLELSRRFAQDARAVGRIARSRTGSSGATRPTIGSHRGGPPAGSDLGHTGTRAPDPALLVC